jgi:hypothetical protein
MVNLPHFQTTAFLSQNDSSKKNVLSTFVGECIAQGVM